MSERCSHPGNTRNATSISSRNQERLKRLGARGAFIVTKEAATKDYVPVKDLFREAAICWEYSLLLRSSEGGGGDPIVKEHGMH